MAEYVIRDAAGKEARREATVDDSIAPTVMQGETAELVEDKPKKTSAKPKAEPPVGAAA